MKKKINDLKNTNSRLKYIIKEESKENKNLKDGLMFLLCKQKK